MQGIKTPIYQTLQIRELERLAQERFGVPPQTMMQRAGKAADDFLSRRWPQAQKITVFCGGGNNGGDGYVLAKQAHERGLKVTIWQIGKQDNLQEAAKLALDACRQANIRINIFSEKEDLGHSDVIVDAICGIGVRDNLRADVVVAIERIKRIQAPILAIDIPSGIDADTGRVLGTALRATATMTYIGMKLGLLTGHGIAYTGELVVDDLQLPSDLYTWVEPVAEKIHLSSYANFLKPRFRDWHKGLSGHVLVIGGDLGYSGAPRMAAEAALRVGAGLVSLATHAENAALVNVNRPEIMSHAAKNAADLDRLLAKTDVLILGPGLGQADWGKQLWEYACEVDLPMVIDADGLNFLAKTKKFNERWVLTPHPGEAARLLNMTVDQVQNDRLAAIQAIHQRYGGTCVLKGAGSLVLAANSLPSLCDKGNPGMASAGMGDVLSGVIGGLMAQGIPLGDATKLGVCMHASAGDMAAKEGERGMLAMDLMPFLRRLSNHSNHN